MYCWFLDEDECVLLVINVCDLNVFCINIYGLYVCCCLKGYVGDGRRCLGIEIKKLFIWKVWFIFVFVILLKIGIFYVLIIVGIK